MDGSPSLDDAGLIGSVRQVLKIGVGGKHFKEGIDVAVVEGAFPRRTTSTFSCDIARSVSRSAMR